MRKISVLLNDRLNQQPGHRHRHLVDLPLLRLCIDLSPRYVGLDCYYNAATVVYLTITIQHYETVNMLWFNVIAIQHRALMPPQVESEIYLL